MPKQWSVVFMSCEIPESPLRLLSEIRTWNKYCRFWSSVYKTERAQMSSIALPVFQIDLRISNSNLVVGVVDRFRRSSKHFVVWWFSCDFQLINVFSNSWWCIDPHCAFLRSFVHVLMPRSPSGAKEYVVVQFSFVHRWFFETRPRFDCVTSLVSIWGFSKLHSCLWLFIVIQGSPGVVF